MSIEIEKVIGMASPLLGFTISLTDVADWLRVVSLLVGIAVGVVSFIHIRQKTRYLKHKKENGKDDG